MDRLLVVEDEIPTLEVLRRYLELFGYEVIGSTTGVDAIQKAIEYQPRVIVLDIILPDMDGYAVCRRLRNDARTSQIPIIFLTQKDSRRDRLDGLELGADDYLTKPFDPEELRLRVHSVIERLGGPSLIDPHTSLPNLALIKERLPQLLGDPNIRFLDAQIMGLHEYGQKYGEIAAAQVTRGAAKIISDVLNEVDPQRAFIGQPREDHFLFATPFHAVEWVAREVKRRFQQRVLMYYDYSDQQRSAMLLGNHWLPLMSLRVMRVKTAALKALANAPDAFFRRGSPRSGSGF